MVVFVHKDGLTALNRKNIVRFEIPNKEINEELKTCLVKFCMETLEGSNWLTFEDLSESTVDSIIKQLRGD